jgi:hypothetical protein
MNKCKCGQTFLFTRDFEHCALCGAALLFGPASNVTIKLPPLPVFESWEDERAFEAGQRLYLNT